MHELGFPCEVCPFYGFQAFCCDCCENTLIKLGCELTDSDDLPDDLPEILIDVLEEKGRVPSGPEVYFFVRRN